MKPHVLWLLIALPFGVGAICLAYADQGFLCFISTGAFAVCTGNAADEYEGA